jgi:hypothetical protein
MSSVDKYRSQQGLSADTTSSYNPDPQLVDWINQAAGETGADPVALLATSLMESGGKLHGSAGDKGTSFGPFQFHIGGALGTHPPSWASTYAAILNRATEFARLGVRGGRGAALVQRPADPKLYAQGVDGLLAQAHAILAKLGGGAFASTTPTATGMPALTGLKGLNQPARDFYAQSGPEAAVGILEAKSPGEARILFENANKKYHVPAQTFKPAALTPPPATTGGVSFAPGGGWGGSYALATTLADIGKGLGLKAVSEKRATKMTASGGVSDHWTGSKTSYAYDMSNGSAPTPQMDKFATQAAAALGVPNWHGGVLNVDKGGYRYQILYRTHVGGNHFNHVHVGVRKL